MIFSIFNSFVFGLWKGILSNGKLGYFDLVNFVFFIEIRVSFISFVFRVLIRKGIGVFWIWERI